MRILLTRGAGTLLALTLGVAAGVLGGCGLEGGARDRTSASAGPRASTSLTVVREEYAARLEQGVNNARRDGSLRPLTHDDCAARAATGRAEQLVGVDELTHRPLDDVLEACGVTLAAENLSRATRPPQEVVEAWLASAGHAANIRNSEFVRGAVACEQDGDEAGTPRMVCVQIFLAE
ncbi:CAP domain-containing protein [Isoptericola sp. NEAU-Y5]|uniref:CAP domain-containing protein n=1 Tax=Isoptericola luteus TaxID=2879484 RepID=A0ABS7ZD76_9MICO|nr:CAP domain-containing protein [Isoptericola sp. NEAU-Y5]MCA5892998.1 CAP domain-containing protein [Isoptericola sp. NEAU-Y5]